MYAKFEKNLTIATLEKKNSKFAKKNRKKIQNSDNFENF